MPLNEALLTACRNKKSRSEEHLIPLGLTIASHCDILIAYMHSHILFDTTLGGL